jgi:hypothetical protein
MTRIVTLPVCLLASLLMAAHVMAADDLQPAVNTSAPAASSSATPVPAPATPPTATPPRAATPAAAAPAARAGSARDRVELENTQITGNRELPKVMYVVPWKKPDLGDFAGRPAKSLLDELLEPVDRDVFKRQNRYFSALQPDAATSSATSSAPSSGSADNQPAALPARGGDEK